MRISYATSIAVLIRFHCRRIAVQIWHQRRQHTAQNEAKVQTAHAKAREEEVRCNSAKNSLRGLKGGFLSKGTEHKSTPATSRTVSKKSQDGKGRRVGTPFEAMKWPEQLPAASAIRQYEALKEKALKDSGSADGVPLAEGETKQRLRQALMECCQLQVPWMHRLQQENQRVRAALERARWQSGATPTADDLGKLNKFDNMCKIETTRVEEEAEWLGDKDGAAGMGDRIWPMAFELHAKASAQNTEREKVVRAHHDKSLKAYAERSAKPWPNELPGATQRVTYEQMKAAVLKQLPQSAQAAMLEGRCAPKVVGGQAARQLRAALMSRCQQVVPLIQRLQAEGRAFKMASERGQVDDDDAARFQAIDAQVKAEIDAVKAEAEWLSDETGTRTGMGDQIWPAAFQIYAKRRAEIAKQIQAAQVQRQQIQTHGEIKPHVAADAID